MRTLAALLSLFLSACGPMEMMTADGVDSTVIEALPAGQYIVSTTYLRLPHTRSALKRFRELTNPMEEDLRANVGLARVTTRLASSCNTARTMSAWKSEVDMYRFVASPSHAKAMAAVRELSRGNSVTTHWSADASGATWEKATQMLAADTDGPIY